MKKYIIASLLAGVALMGFTSCEDDRDSNPTLTVPDSFVLNTPALAGNVYDLANCEGIELSCKQPEFGYTAAVSYYPQLSLTNEWENVLDENGEIVGNPKFVQLESYSTKAKFDVAAKDFNKAIMKIGGYTAEEQIPDNLDVYIRLNGVLSSKQNTYSNSITVKVKPFFQALVAADTELWYLIGACVGDGAWGSEIGVSVYPMSPVEGGKFDEATGKGPLTFTNTLTFTALDKEPAEYSQMMIAGDFTNWGDGAVSMSPVDTYAGARPHVWMYDMSITENTGMKFLVDSSWNPNWGGANFPFGWGVGGGDNIPVEAGDYRVIFNDITGYYHFYSK